jgi:putative NAD(P)-binding protein
MLGRRGAPPEEIALDWMDAFGRAMQDRSERALYRLFAAQSHWRNLFGLSWHFETVSGAENLVPKLLACAGEVGTREFRIDTAALTPRRSVIAGCDAIEAVFYFVTINGPGIGSLRLSGSPDGQVKAWTISTTLDFDRICESRASGAVPSDASDVTARDRAEPGRASGSFRDREADVLIVGGGHAGTSVAVELKRIGCEVLVIDKQERVGGQLAEALPRPEAS